MPRTLPSDRVTVTIDPVTQLSAGTADHDPTRVSPEVYSTRLENEHVRVLEIRLSPGSRDQVHSHPDEALLFLNPARVRITLSNGQVVEKEVAAGEVMSACTLPWSSESAGV